MHDLSGTPFSSCYFDSVKPTRTIDKRLNPSRNTAQFRSARYYAALPSSFASSRDIESWCYSTVIDTRLHLPIHQTSCVAKMENLNMPSSTYVPKLALTVISSISIGVAALASIWLTFDIVHRRGWRSMMAIM